MLRWGGRSGSQKSRSRNGGRHQIGPSGSPPSPRRSESLGSEDWEWQSQNLSGIAVPTLLLTGSETPPELAEITSLTAAAIPGARIHVLAGHGHVAHVSEPGLVAQVLRNWLE